MQTLKKTWDLTLSLIAFDYNPPTKAYLIAYIIMLLQMLGVIVHP